MAFGAPHDQRLTNSRPGRSDPWPFAPGATGLNDLSMKEELAEMFDGVRFLQRCIPIGRRGPQRPAISFLETVEYASLFHPAPSSRS